MDFEKFRELAKDNKTVPVYKRILADLLTPISTYMRLSKNADFSFILESAENTNQYGRYSFIGRNPELVMRSKDGLTQILKGDRWEIQNSSFIEYLRMIYGNYKTPKLVGLPSFTGGLVGYMGYESIVWIEDIPIHGSSDVEYQDAVFMLFTELISFDHFKNQIILFKNIQIEKNLDLEIAYREAQHDIDRIGEDLHTDIDYQTPQKQKKSTLDSSFTEQKCKEALLSSKEYIKAGDIFQVVLSQRFTRETNASPLSIYRALRSINPSPYMFYFELNQFSIVGASPELLVKVEDSEIEIRPIAGTRKRGLSTISDREIASELISDEKERAEHLMLVDLGRNDVGKTAKYHSVHVKEFMLVEYYSHVMHIVSDVRGKLKDDSDIFDALYSGFPAGTLTGAPKIRAMEIINQLEPKKRGLYGGAIGYFDFSGDMNTCIAIRTMVVKDGKVYFQSGAGIVIDSNPDKEFEETIHKAQAINSAIDLAEKGLVK